MQRLLRVIVNGSVNPYSVGFDKKNKLPHLHHHHHVSQIVSSSGYSDIDMVVNFIHEDVMSDPDQI